MTPKQIRKLRKALELTQGEFAELLGSHQVCVSRWETGFYKPIGIYRKTLLKLAKELKEGQL